MRGRDSLYALRQFFWLSCVTPDREPDIRLLRVPTRERWKPELGQVELEEPHQAGWDR